MNPAAAMAWLARSTIWRAEGKKRSDVNWKALREQYDYANSPPDVTVVVDNGWTQRELAGRMKTTADGKWFVELTTETYPQPAPTRYPQTRPCDHANR